MMDVYRSLDRDQIQFDFITLQQNEQYFEKEIESLGGKVIKLHSPRETGIKNHIKELRECMRQGQYRAVHAHTSYHCGIVMYAAKKEGIPVRIAHARTNGSIQKDLKTKAYIAFGGALINRYSTDRLAISKQSGDFVFGHADFELVPNSIDLSLYQDISQESSMHLQRELNLPDGGVIFGHVGRFDRFKNQRFIIDIFYEFQKQNPDSRLVLVGDGELRRELEQCVEELSIKEKVVFTGVRNDIPVLMKVFDILIFPSIVEGLGGVVLEAQAAGTPAVISENVSETVDVGLGLVKRCSLDESITKWIEIINSSLLTKRPDFNTISCCFDRAGYTLASSVKRYEEIYRGKTADER